MKKSLLLFLSAAVLAPAVIGCSSSTDSTPASTTYVGSIDTLPGGMGMIKSWMTVDGNNAPTSMGVTFDSATIANVPLDTMMTMLPLSLPSQKSVTPFDHMEIDWEPQGHPPPGVYTVPHFDVHFYTIDQATQMAITVPPMKDTVAVDSMILPVGYLTDSSIVPDMGVHWSPITDFTAGHPFSETLIYGTYHGKMAFLEPMVTLATLSSKMNQTWSVPQPRGFSAVTGKYFPTTYSVSYDATAKTYSVTLENFVKH